MQVYLVTNRVNGKKYIGQTIQTLKKRWSSHGSDAKRNRGPNALVNALLKYGKENFTIETLKFCKTKTELNKEEKNLIKKLKTKAPFGYNIAEGGDGTLGVPYTQEQLKKFRKTIGNTRKGSGNSFFGKKHTKESRDKMSIAKLGKPRASGSWQNRATKHGTASGYKVHGCRCKLCRKYRRNLYIRTGN